MKKLNFFGKRLLSAAEVRLLNVAKRLLSVAEVRLPSVAEVLLLATMMCAPLTASAQVTIGSDAVPERAALLDLKTQAPNANNATTDKGGLLLPRVELVNRYTLEPFIAAATADEKRNHTGLTVYNVTNNAAAGLEPGYYHWDGETWHKTVTELPQPEGSIMNMADVPVGGVLLSDATSTGASYRSTAVVPFDQPLSIPSNGNYAFVFRLWGSVIQNIAQAPFDARNIRMYISLCRNGVIVDAIETNVQTLTGRATTQFDKEITLAGTFSAGDFVEILTAYRSTDWNDSLGEMSILSHSPRPGVARSSIVWWRL